MKRIAAAVAATSLLTGCGLLGGESEVPVTVTVTAPAPPPATQASAPSAPPAPSATPTPTPTPTPSATPTPTETLTPSTTVSAAPASTTPPPRELDDAFKETSDSVVRLEVATCETFGQASGFLVADDLVATAAHAVEQGQVVRIISGTTSVAGTVIGLDHKADVALIASSAPFDHAPIAFSDRAPEIGDEVAAIGFTQGEAVSYKPGTINGLDRKTIIDGTARYGLLELDFAANEGNSGGPVVDADGRVVGLVHAGPDGEQGGRLVVPASRIQPLLAAWDASPAPPERADCSEVVGVDGESVPAERFPEASMPQAFHTLSIYFDAIERADFSTAVAQLARPADLDTFKTGVQSSQSYDFKTMETREDAGSPLVWLQFTSEQEAGAGPAERPYETCTQWSLDYHFALKNGLWLIDRVVEHPGFAKSTPCEEIGD